MYKDIYARGHVHETARVAEVRSATLFKPAIVDEKVVEADVTSSFRTG